MGSRHLRLVAILLVAGLVVGVGAVAYAQNPGVTECQDEKFDIDGNGVFNSADADAWKLTFVRSGCELGGQVGECPAVLDLDGDGLVARADLDELLDAYKLCYRPWPYIVPGR